ncbi:MAG TPA: hypothetical protein VJB59_09920 [Bdellovibrionota bacterium]|nr:hypothetical protein [Bdellovibrionota bacterium]
MGVLNQKNLQLGPNLTRLIRSSGETVKSLSRKLGIAQSTLFGFCVNIMPRNPEHIRTLCEHFKITSDELLFGIKPDKTIRPGDRICATIEIVEIHKENPNED